MSEKNLDGFDHTVSSLHCDTLSGDLLLQVTQQGCRLVNAASQTLITSWSAPAGTTITVAASSPTQVVVALTNREVVLLEVSGQALNQAATATMPQEVSALSVHPFLSAEDMAAAASADKMDEDEDEDAIPPPRPLRAAFVAVGLWVDVGVKVLSATDLSEVASTDLPGDIQPKSVLTATLGDANFLLAGLADGHLFSFRIDPASGALSNRKKISLGSQPVGLVPFFSGSTLLVFASCDRPTVVQATGEKLTYCNVNRKQVRAAC